jgi:thiamine-phosphate pyrophosphorylase
MPLSAALAATQHTTSVAPGTPTARLHLLTDTRAGRDPLREVRAACRLARECGPGTVAVQVRDKDHGDRDVLTLTRHVLELAAPCGVTVIVDDRLDVAMAAGAAGVHLGVTDLPIAEARCLTGPGLVIGGTVRSPHAAVDAERAGATYLGVGPTRATATKPGLPDPLGVQGIAAVAAATALPVIAIGGVTPDLVPALHAAGAHGVAVVSAVSAASDPLAVLRRFARALEVAA